LDEARKNKFRKVLMKGKNGGDGNFIGILLIISDEPSMIIRLLPNL